MKPIRKIPVIILLLIGWFTTVEAQDLHFSQFFETPLLRNPALAGLFSGDVRFQAVYRNQWNSVTVPYQTASINGEYKTAVGANNDFITIGGQIFYDKAGSTALTTIQVLPVLNYHKSLNDEKNRYLSLGAMAGIVQRRIDRSKITTDNQFDGTSFNPGLADGENLANNSYKYFDGSIGMSYNSQIGDKADNNIFIGAAYHHFMKPKGTSFFNNPDVAVTPKWVYSMGLRFSMTDFSYFTVQGDYTTQGINKEIIGGAIYSIKLDNSDDPKYLLHAGTFLRWGDALIPVAKIECRPITVSVSYDVNISTLKSASRGQGGFEFSLIYQKYRGNGNTSLDAVRCPKF